MGGTAPPVWLTKSNAFFHCSIPALINNWRRRLFSSYALVIQMAMRLDIAPIADPPSAPIKTKCSGFIINFSPQQRHTLGVANRWEPKAHCDWLGYIVSILNSGQMGVYCLKTK